MKRNIYLVIASLAMFACQNEELVNESLQMERAKVQLVQVTDGGQILPVTNGARVAESNASYVLQFDSQSTYEATIKQLETMPVAEKLAFAERYGLQSLQQLAVVADEELEQIADEATSEADFREKYEVYKAKYAGVLIPNPYDSSDLSLYVPDGDELSTYLMNSNSMIAIGNEVVTKQLKNDMGRSDKVCFVGKDKLAIGGVETMANLDCGDQVVKDSKKTTYTVSLDPASLFVNVSIGIQKKRWYGWKRDDHRDIYYNIGLTNFTYNFWGPYNQQINVPCPSLYVFKGTGKIDYKTGYLTGGARSLTGKLFVWTDIIVGTENVTYQYVAMDKEWYPTATLPKCDRNNAYSVDVNLSL